MNVTNVSMTEAENTGWDYPTVSLSHPSTHSTRPGFSVAVSGTATGGGTDYNALSPTSYTFSSSNTSTTSLTSTFDIYVQDDNLDEDAETIIFTITPSNATAGSNLATTMTINDNDEAPDIDFTSASGSASEGNSGTSAKTAQVTLSTASGKDVSANYTVGGTSTGGGTDHSAAAGTVDISAGNTTANISFNLVGETTYELDETIILTLASATNADVRGQDTHTYTITNDDAAPTIDFNAASASGTLLTTEVAIYESALTDKE